MENKNKTDMENATQMSSIITTEHFCCKQKKSLGSFTMILSIILFFTAIVICFGNILVIFAYYKAKRLQTVSNFLVMHLAVADLATGLFMPYVSVLYLNPDMITSTYLCITRYFIMLTFPMMSLYMLTLMTVDRFTAITNPLRYNSIFIKKRLKIVIVILWIITITICTAFPFVWHNHSATVCDFVSVMLREYLGSVCISSFYIACILIACLNIRMFLIARQKANVISCYSSVMEGKNLKKDVKAAKTTAIVLVTFFACWAPFMVTMTMQVFWTDAERYAIFTQIQGYLAAFTVFNSFCNPIIYTFRVRAFREEFYKLILCCKSNKVINLKANVIKPI